MGDPKKLGELFVGIDKVLEYLIPLAGLLAIVFIVIGGYMWISSAGNPEKIKQAQGTLTWAVIGLIFIFLIDALLETLIDYLVGL